VEEAVIPPTQEARGVRTSLAPVLAKSAAILKKTIAPPSERERRIRMGVFAALCAVIVAICYALTRRMIWAFVMLIVGVPIVGLPVLILVGMAFEARARRHGDAPKNDGHG
jgi:Mn2+/Fe2+ NRAMP family transporter